jgi:hypothetical protein
MGAGEESAAEVARVGTGSTKVSSTDLISKPSAGEAKRELAGGRADRSLVPCTTARSAEDAEQSLEAEVTMVTDHAGMDTEGEKWQVAEESVLMLDRKDTQPEEEE